MTKSNSHKLQYHKVPSNRTVRNMRNVKENANFFLYDKDDIADYCNKIKQQLILELDCYTFREVIGYCKWLLEKKELTTEEQYMLKWYNYFIIEKKDKINILGNNKLYMGLFGSINVVFKQ